MQNTLHGDTWKLIQTRIEGFLKNQRDSLEQANGTYKDKLLAIGQINAYKTILNLPHVLELELLAAKGK